MDRREALRSVAILLGTTISAGTTNILFSSYTLPEGEKNTVSFSAEQLKTLTEIADVIIPTTKSSPGAKAAGVGKFIPMMVKDCYPAKQQQSFYNGLVAFELSAKKTYKKSFALIPLAERKKMLTQLRQDTLDQKKNKFPEKVDIAYFFTLMRDLTSLGYFASEIGCTQAREYLMIPGSYDGAYPLKPGQKSWAT
ncbi:gluconate 2-dehydrogenase subunit 3 family protein [Pedobacter sp. UBA4863]|uniref:gluconate 2-dehydrogenase subunit 3 family protein n=1 Tax=Pedobacter sp. UBA4863 TaxID=1947060 RepID=UPI0025DB08B4|nr:gluconate 2-dehydrogenase subunit 3 family protein [Pedobacter sp. UBA4863]